MYREPSKPEKKPVRATLSLTRGEVVKIVTDHLAKSGKFPNTPNGGTTTLAALTIDQGGGYIGPEKDELKKKWDDWICLKLTWLEDP